MLQTVSHDFRTPLATIGAAVEGLRARSRAVRGRSCGAARDDSLEVTRLTRLVGNLLDLSRLQAGAAAPRPSSGRSTTYRHERWPTCRRRVAVGSVLRRSCRAVAVDAVQIQRVLVNLIDNALKFSAGDVEVRAHARRRRVLLEVIDRGRGVGEPRRSMLGLGLAIARGLARGTAGRSSLTAEDGGTRARLTCPPAHASDGRAVTRASSSSTTSRSSCARSTNLRGAGYEVDTADTAAEALAAAALRPPDAVILDLLLPDGTGRRSAASSGGGREAPIIFISAVGDEDEKIAALDAGADDYVTKPFAIGSCLRACAPRSPGRRRRASRSSSRSIRVDLEKPSSPSTASRAPDAARVRDPRCSLTTRGSSSAPRDPARGVGAGLRRRVELPPCVRSQLRRKLEPDPAGRGTC